MRKMQDYIVKGKEIFVGLEDSKKTWKVAVRCEKMLIHEASMPTEYQNLITYLRNKYPECRISLLYEAGFHGFWLHDLLMKDGIPCVVVPPHTVTQEKTSRVKTDKIDARRLAQNLENGDYKTCHVPDQERREDRQLSRTIEDVQGNVVRTRNQIWKMLDFHGVILPEMKSVPTKNEIRALRNLKISPMVKQALGIYLDQLDLLWKQLESLRKELRELAKKARYVKTYDIIRSFPGIGWYTAIRLVLEWGEDLSRFANRRKIASFVGLTGLEHSTGETVRRGHLTGLGQKRSRTWLVEAAWVAIRKDPALLDKFKRVFRNTGSKKKAIVATARKLVGRLLHCVTTGQEYQVGLVAQGCEVVQ